MGQVKAFYAAQSGQYESQAAEQQETVKRMFLLLCNGQPLALYDHRDMAEYEMHICIQGDRYEGIESKYRIKTMGVVTHAYEEETE
jgi:tRNA G37 N-methylase TrmD